MLKLSKPQQLNITLQLLFWILRYLGISIVLFGGINWVGFCVALKYAPITFCTYYVCNLLLVPRLWLRKKYSKFFTIATALIIVLSFISGVLHSNYYHPTFYWIENPYIILQPFFVAVILQIVTALAASFTAIIVINYKGLLKRNAIKSEIVNTQLIFLMHQIQPHFLFNTINNLYALTLEKSDKMPIALLHLSNLLRYIVYESKDNKIALKKELEAIEWYIAIFQLRFDETSNITKNIESDTSIIPQNSLLTLFENAVKHSQIGQYENGYISLVSKVVNNELVLAITNTIDEEQEMLQSNSGFGLSNLKKRLEIMYPDKNILTIANDGKLFVATLNIPLQ